MNNIKLIEMIKAEFEALDENNFSTLNRSKDPMWDPPLVGIARGDDEYFDFLKSHIGNFHWSPVDAFKLKYKDEEVIPSNLFVVCLAFPQTNSTKESQKKESLCPSREWIVSRGEWEPLMANYSKNIISSLEKKGIRAVAIDLQNEFHVDKSGPTGIASTWSHRHYAFAAGLGTFGLSDGLITRKGKAVRFTSYIVEAPLIETKREYKDPYEWCLYYKNGSCGMCVKRCPVSAINLDSGHDKNSCLDYEDYFAEHYWPLGLDRKNYILGCGLCQVGIPCQDKKPE